MNEYEAVLHELAFIGREFAHDRLYMDVGSNLGQGYAYFSHFLKPVYYDSVLIEPNPHCLQTLRRKYGQHSNMEIIEAAAWKEDGELSLYGLVEDERGTTSQGASVVSDHNSSLYETNKNQALCVPAISLSRLIFEKAQCYDHIILKLDIESSEYEVLPELLQSGALSHVYHLFIEFHSQYFKEPQKSQYLSKEREMIEQLNAARIDFTLWR